LPLNETLDVGEDRGTPILEDYADRTPFRYPGRIDEVEISLPGGNAAHDVPDIDSK
jgi:arylsulfatase